jgi:hypothetical protein
MHYGYSAAACGSGGEVLYLARLMAMLDCKALPLPTQNIRHGISGTCYGNAAEGSIFFTKELENAAWEIVAECDGRLLEHFQVLAMIRVTYAVPIPRPQGYPSIAPRRTLRFFKQSNETARFRDFHRLSAKSIRINGVRCGTCTSMSVGSEWIFILLLVHLSYLFFIGNQADDCQQ